jgi:hypothetical protein
MLFWSDKHSEDPVQKISVDLIQLGPNDDYEYSFGSLSDISASLNSIRKELNEAREEIIQYKGLAGLESQLNGVKNALQIQNFMNANLPINEKPLNWSLEELETALILLDGDVTKMAALIKCKESNIKDNIRKKKKEVEMKNWGRKSSY